MLGFVIGSAMGAAQYVMLSKYTRAISTGVFGVKTALFGVLQFFFPFIVLAGCAVFFRQGLMWAGIGMAVALSGCALTRFVRGRIKGRDSEDA